MNMNLMFIIAMFVSAVMIVIIGRNMLKMYLGLIVIFDVIIMGIIWILLNNNSINASSELFYEYIILSIILLKCILTIVFIVLIGKFQDKTNIIHRDYRMKHYD